MIELQFVYINCVSNFSLKFLLECQRQQLSMEEKLAKRRQRELQKLSREQEKEEELFMKNIDKSTNTKGLAVVSYICMTTQIRQLILQIKL